MIASTPGGDWVLTVPSSEPPAALVRTEWIAFAALAQRLARLDPFLMVRLRAGSHHRRTLAWLPSGALVGSTIATPAGEPGGQSVDLTTQAGALIDWLDGGDPNGLPRVDSGWLTAVPPERNWRRVETVPASVVRDLVRLGAQAHVDAADNQLGARTANALLDTPVLIATDGAVRAEVTNRTLSAVISMGFLPDDGEVVVAVSGRWTRVAAARGSAFAQDRPDGLRLA